MIAMLGATCLKGSIIIYSKMLRFIQQTDFTALTFSLPVPVFPYYSKLLIPVRNAAFVVWNMQVHFIEVMEAPSTNAVFWLREGMKECRIHNSSA
jgi:hypothetical protein